MGWVAGPFRLEAVSGFEAHRSIRGRTALVTSEYVVTEVPLAGQWAGFRAECARIVEMQSDFDVLEIKGVITLPAYRDYVGIVFLPRLLVIWEHQFRDVVSLGDNPPSQEVRHLVGTEDFRDLTAYFKPPPSQGRPQLRPNGRIGRREQESPGSSAESVLVTYSGGNRSSQAGSPGQSFISPTNSQLSFCTPQAEEVGLRDRAGVEDMIRGAMAGIMDEKLNDIKQENAKLQADISRLQEESSEQDRCSRDDREQIRALEERLESVRTAQESAACCSRGDQG